MIVWATLANRHIPLFPYGLAVVAVTMWARVSIWLTPRLLVRWSLFSGRCCSLMHDCGSSMRYFRSKR